jgi:RNA polymerase subunit RPABC4/transcription elongation factor Spt4
MTVIERQKCPRCGELAVLLVLPAPSTEEVCWPCKKITLLENWEGR